MNILAGGYPTSVKTACSGGAVLDAVEEYAASPGSNTLTYDPTTGLYGYNWKTDKNWKGTCRDFTLKFIDGSLVRVKFLFQ